MPFLEAGTQLNEEIAIFPLSWKQNCPINPSLLRIRGIYLVNIVRPGQFDPGHNTIHINTMFSF